MTGQERPHEVAWSDAQGMYRDESLSRSSRTDLHLSCDSAVSYAVASCQLCREAPAAEATPFCDSHHLVTQQDGSTSAQCGTTQGPTSAQSFPSCWLRFCWGCAMVSFSLSVLLSSLYFPKTTWHHARPGTMFNTGLFQRFRER